MFRTLPAHMDTATLRRRLRAAREFRGYESQEDLARAAKGARGFSRQNISLWERGAVVPDRLQLAEYARLCGVPLTWLTDASYDPVTGLDAAQDELPIDPGQAAYVALGRIEEKVDGLYTLLREDMIRRKTEGRPADRQQTSPVRKETRRRPGN